MLTCFGVFVLLLSAQQMAEKKFRDCSRFMPKSSISDTGTTVQRHENISERRPLIRLRDILPDKDQSVRDSSPEVSNLPRLSTNIENVPAHTP